MTKSTGTTHESVTVRPSKVEPTPDETEAMRMWIERGAVPGGYLSSVVDGAMVLSAAEEPDASRMVYVAANRERAK